MPSQTSLLIQNWCLVSLLGSTSLMVNLSQIILNISTMPIGCKIELKKIDSWSYRCWRTAQSYAKLDKLRATRTKMVNGKREWWHKSYFKKEFWVSWIKRPWKKKVKFLNIFPKIILFGIVEWNSYKKWRLLY